MTSSKQMAALLSLSLALGAGLASAQEQLPPSITPPGGLDTAKIPQLICLGFDDNRYADGIRWVTGTLLKNRRNPAGQGNLATFDGTPMRATFYATSNADQKAPLREAYDLGFEIGNHTHTHEHNMSDLSYALSIQEIGQCSKYLVNQVGLPPSQIYGFRTPFLAFSPDNTSFRVLRDLGFLYDCTLDNGTQGSPLRFASPYFPGTMEKGWIWYTTLTNPGLWQAPSAVFLAPGESIPRVLGFDSNLWPNTSGANFAAILKATLDWHYKGSRAPLDLGLHSDYYTGENQSPAVLAFPTSFAERRQALVDFLDYAQTLPDVRVVNMVDFIRWMRNPAVLDDLSKNALYALDAAVASPNILGLGGVAATGRGMTAALSGGTLTATGSIDATGRFVAARAGDVVLNLGKDLGGAKGLSITYTSKTPLRITLVQSDLSDSLYHFWEVPASPQARTEAAPMTAVYFEKPRYRTGSPLDPAKVQSLAIAPMALDAQVDGSFQVTSIRIFGNTNFGGTPVAKPSLRNAGAATHVVALDRNRVLLYAAKPGAYALRFFSPSGALLAATPTRRLSGGSHALTVPRNLPGGLLAIQVLGPEGTSLQRMLLEPAKR